MDRDTYLERVRELIPGIRERAATCETLRRLPDETFKEFQEAGLLRAVQPARWGGYELSPLTFFEAVMEVSAACPSSGCDPCKWVFLGGMVPNDGPAPDMRTFLVPRSDYEIIDNWYVSGLAGTGSKDIEVEGAFVPEHRTHSFTDAYNIANPGQAVNTATSFKLPFGSVFAFAISMPAIGAAQGALDHHRGYIREKVSALIGAKVADDPFAQRRIAVAVAEIDAAKAEVRSTWETIWALADAGETIPLEMRAKARWTAANVVQRSVRAVDLLFEGSGGHAIYLDNPIQRFFRDVHAMRAHAVHNPDNAALAFGFTELHPGEPPREFLL